MPRTIDHYGYWNKYNINKKRCLLDRENTSIKLMSKIVRKNSNFLDLGCGNGYFLLQVKKRFPEINVEGIDFSKSEVEEARKSGLDVSIGNFEEKIKIKSRTIDLVYAGELIEHLFNPDFFLGEINRIIKNEKYLILSTPNLCAWYNRVLMPLGIQPLFLEPSTKSSLVGAGFLKKFKKSSQPVGHVRIFTFSALKDLLEMHGFTIIERKGSIFDEGLPKKLWPLDRIFNSLPKLASHFVILAKKVKDI